MSPLAVIASIVLAAALPSLLLVVALCRAAAATPPPAPPRLRRLELVRRRLQSPTPQRTATPRRPTLACLSYEIHGRDGIASEWGAYCSLPANHEGPHQHTERDYVVEDTTTEPELPELPKVARLIDRIHTDYVKIEGLAYSNDVRQALAHTTTTTDQERPTQ